VGEGDEGSDETITERKSNAKRKLLPGENEGLEGSTNRVRRVLYWVYNPSINSVNTHDYPITTHPRGAPYQPHPHPTDFFLGPHTVIELELPKLN
jgi:hypothetical protein